MRPSAEAEVHAGERFMFATGIECSNPVAIDTNGRRKRIDELELTFHYAHWKEDLRLVRRLGLTYLRYGPPWFRVHLGPGRYDWEFTDAVFAEMQRLGIVPIVDLCHFGVPDWIGDFQNPDWPHAFAEYALAFAQRFPWVRLYTPVNEIYVCAKLSTLVGLWNERARGDHRAFVTAIKHLSKANLLAIGRILTARPDAIFIQSESAEYFHLGGSDPASVHRANWENELRFLSLDLLFSHQPSADITAYLFDNGLTRAELDWFMSHGLSSRIVMGNDYYDRNEQVIEEHGAARPAGEVFGWAVIARQYFDRYRRPVMHTETNTFNADDAPRWLWKEFYNVRYLREQGVPVVGFTWYSLLDQVDWDSALAQERGVVNALGLFDLQRRPRPVAAAYLELLRQFADEPLLPKQPLQVANTDLYRLRGEENVFGAGRSWSFWSSSR
jgi:beta-glucosidase/6-phospho-beta-glucosidase/beta-galactosidase